MLWSTVLPIQDRTRLISISAVVDGEGIRSQLIDDQAGVPVYLDIQVIDVNTCEPLQDTFLEMWNANSTGIYSGAISSANGNANDKSNLNKVFLRGAQKTNKDGAVQFTTIFPGHYQGRATHIHIISHYNDSTTVYANNTIWGTRVTHNGQAFFDQSLIDAVEKVSPYSTNRQARTQNKADAILLQEAATSDPFFRYVQLGTDLKRDGIFAWFTFGVNTTLTRDIMAVAKHYASGGQVVTTNPKLPGFSGMFPGGFPTAWQPGFGPSPTMTPVTVTTKRP
ncbi:hypothetical protein NEMBOFW57_008170 [Staphylotrichum longicolle]|uniref:Intradiol ring-cleavage dioxygenases domain-containing protein n=1 Tax=Staphylotrichum longicolle TaxID=669026 RepID=A0AAD4ER58_9PEZI|nr:hypothetical protein NEMBOFW57_008170 [Staphylotrichum longicolle]